MTISLIVAGLIGTAVLILSYLHTAGLFERSGYHEAFAHIGVIGFELTFVFGTGIALWTKLQGEKPAGSTRFIMWLGISVNLYSNVTSGIATEGKPLIFFSVWGIPIGEPVLIGALIPLLFWAAERIVMDCISMYLELKQLDESTTETEPTATVSQQPTTDTEQQEIVATVEKATPTENETNSNKIASTENIQQIKTVEPTEIKQQQSTDWEPTELPPVHQQQKTVATVTKATATEKKPTVTKSVTTGKTKQQSKATEKENERVLEIAKQHLLATGKAPGRDKLVELAGCSSNRSRIVLLMLKEEQEQQSEQQKTVATNSKQQSPTEKTTVPPTATEFIQEPTKLELVQ